MSDVISIAVRCVAIAEDVIEPILATMNREKWPTDLRVIVLRAIAARFEKEAADQEE